MLCDVFEKFIDVCLKDYGLDPCHYFSKSWTCLGCHVKNGRY